MNFEESFIANMPKAELHLHVEGTVQPEMLLQLAEKNNVDLPYKTLDEVIAAQDYGLSGMRALNNFLDYLTDCKLVLCTRQDFYDVTYAFMERCSQEKIVYVEMMFDPQSHLERDISFFDFFSGIKQACQDGKQHFGVESNLIMCIHRDKTVESAMEAMDLAAPYKEQILGLGFDNYELDDFHLTFQPVAERAKKEGYRLTSHCDCDLEKSLEHIRGCIEVLKVDRIDHGVNSVEEPELMALVKEKNIGLTMCPTWRIGEDKPRRMGRIKQLLDYGILVSVNTDDPALFASGYLCNLLNGMNRSGEFSLSELVRLMENAFISSWLPADRKTQYLAQLQQYAESNTVPL